MFDLFWNIWCLRKAKSILQVTPELTEEVLRNGMAYAWEIGFGQPMREMVTPTSYNPFLNPDWREGVFTDGEME